MSSINYEWSYHLSKHVKSLALTISLQPCLSIKCTEKKRQIASQQNDEKLPIKLKQLGLIVPINIVFPMHTMIAWLSLFRCLCRCTRCAESRWISRLPLHMHVSAYAVPFQRGKKHSLRAACHQKVLFWNSHKCILHTRTAGNNRKKLNLTMSEDISQQKTRQMTFECWQRRHKCPWASEKCAWKKWIISLPSSRMPFARAIER